MDEVSSRSPTPKSLRDDRFDYRKKAEPRLERGRTDKIPFSVFFVLLLNLESDFQTSIFETTEKYEI